MKKVLVVILILLVAVQSFSKWLILLDYQVNQDYIAQVLCVNKAKPALGCKGKCQLVKLLATEEKQEHSKQGAAKVQFAEVLFAAEGPGERTAPTELPDASAHTRYLVATTTAPVSSIFHPPLQS